MTDESESTSRRKALSFLATAPVAVLPNAAAAQNINLYTGNAEPAEKSRPDITLKRISSINELRKIRPTKGFNLLTDGYNLAGDGGHGQYYAMLSGGPYTDNGGSIIVAGNGVGSTAPTCWKLLITGDLNVKQFGARGDSRTDDTAAFKASIAAAEKLGKKAIFAPRGIYKITSTITSRVGLIGEGGQPATSKNGTVLEYYGAGFCLDFTYPEVVSSFALYGKGQKQGGIRISAGVMLKMTNVQLWDFDRIGMQLYQSSVGQCLFCTFENVSIINQNAVVGQIGLLCGGSGLYNSNSNTFINVFVKGKWKICYEICGNGNIFIGGDCEPNNYAKDFTKYWYIIRGNTNQIKNPYIEPYNQGGLSSDHMARYKPITFSGFWKVIEFLDNPTPGDSIDINGSEITFVATRPTTTQCAIGATVDETVSNLANMINSASDPNLARLNADERFTEIVVHSRVYNPPPGPILCRSANNAFRLPKGYGESVWGIPSGNAFEGTNWTNTYYGSTYGSIEDIGIANDVKISRIASYSAQPTGRKFSTRNLAPNSEFRHLYRDTNGKILPTGYSLQRITAGVNITRVTTPTPNGAPYALKIDCPTGEHFELCYSPVHNVPAQLSTSPILLEKLLNKTVVMGVWCKSNAQGLGALVFFDGYSVNGGRAAHNGSDDWLFLTVSGRIASSQINQIRFCMSNNITLTGTTESEGASGGAFYISQPVFMFGVDIPDVHQPLLLDDCDAASMGRLTLNPPQILLSSAGAIDSATPSVAEFNLYTEANSSPTKLTHFVGGRSGQEITIFTTTAYTTFVHNPKPMPNTLYLKTGANTPTSANRAYKFIFNGTKWYEI